MHKTVKMHFNYFAQILSWHVKWNFWASLWTPNLTRTFQYSVFAENKSCSGIKLSSPNAPSGSYVIDPGGEGGVAPFTIYCDMTDKNTIGVTVISHDSEDRTLVQGCLPAGCYQRDIHYTGANFLQLGKLTSISAHCERLSSTNALGH